MQVLGSSKVNEEMILRRPELDCSACSLTTLVFPRPQQLVIIYTKCNLIMTLQTHKGRKGERKGRWGRREGRRKTKSHALLDAQTLKLNLVPQAAKHAHQEKNSSQEQSKGIPPLAFTPEDFLTLLLKQLLAAVKG